MITINNTIILIIKLFLLLLLLLLSFFINIYITGLASETDVHRVYYAERKVFCELYVAIIIISFFDFIIYFFCYPLIFSVIWYYKNKVLIYAKLPSYDKD